MKKLLVVAFVLSLTFGLVLQTAAAPHSPTSMNARFMKWQELPHVIHIFVFNDAGRPGFGSAVVDEGQPVLLGFEWGGESVEQLQADFIDNPDHDITLSIDGGASFSVKGYYQTPFEAATRSGPAWSWDHDGDGPGDKDGDGIGDWDGPVLFFRYQSEGLSPGTHTFEFTVIDLPLPPETITVMVP